MIVFPLKISYFCWSFVFINNNFYLNASTKKNVTLFLNITQKTELDYEGLKNGLQKWQRVLKKHLELEILLNVTGCFGILRCRIIHMQLHHFTGGWRHSTQDISTFQRVIWDQSDNLVVSEQKSLRQFWVFWFNTFHYKYHFQFLCFPVLFLVQFFFFCFLCVTSLWVIKHYILTTVENYKIFCFE